MTRLRPRIAIPVPHSQKPEYAQRSLPQYVSAVEQAGGEAVVIPLDWEAERIAKEISTCNAVLLPGSPADVDPQKYGAQKIAQTAAPDPLRDAADELLLQDAYNLRKPILGICYGLQSLNVWRTGSLVQDIALQLNSPVKHEAGREVAQAHVAEVSPHSRLAEIVGAEDAARIAVNSSHHQAAQRVGDGLRVSARCPDDDVVEAIEGADPGHFVLAVQWHPERTCDQPESRALFKALVGAAAKKAEEG